MRRHIDVDEGTLARLPVVLATIANTMAAPGCSPLARTSQTVAAVPLPVLRSERRGHGDAVGAVAE